MFAFRDRLGAVEVAFTDRAGGVSAAPFTSLNLAATGRDESAAVAENLRRVVTSFAGDGGPVAAMHQVHGADVAVVTRGLARLVPGVEGLPSVDAVVTDRPQLTLMVRMADCVPVLLADVDREVVAAVHAGRAGLVAGVIPQAVATMRELGAARLIAWVGPHICGRCYEVPEELRADVSRATPAAWAETAWGTPALDVGAGVVAQLEEDGVGVKNVARCTYEDAALYSYRRDRADAGRLAGLVRVAR